MTGNMTYARYGHTESVLNNGKVLISGGYNNNGGGDPSGAELYDPSTGNWTATMYMHNAHSLHT